MIRTIISFALVAYALYKVFEKHRAVQATKPAAQPGPQSVSGAPLSSHEIAAIQFPPAFRSPIAVNNR